MYTGITTDVARRYGEHAEQGQKCAKYLRGKGPLELVFHQEAGDRAEATRLELLLKKLPKEKKELLIENKLQLKTLLSTES